MVCFKREDLQEKFMCCHFTCSMERLYSIEQQGTRSRQLFCVCISPWVQLSVNLLTSTLNVIVVKPVRWVLFGAKFTEGSLQTTNNHIISLYSDARAMWKSSLPSSLMYSLFEECFPVLFCGSCFGNTFHFLSARLMKTCTYILLESAHMFT